MVKTARHHGRFGCIIDGGINYYSVFISGRGSVSLPLGGFREEAGHDDDYDVVDDGWQ